MDPTLAEKFLIDHRTPFDALAAKEDPAAVPHYREAAVKFYNVLALILNFIAKSKNPKHAALGVAFALKVFPLVEESQREKARKIGVSHGTISSYSVKFSKELSESL